MKRNILCVAAALIMTGGVYAQGQFLDDASLNVFKFSQLGLNGTASYVGRAGAIGALGADFMAASYNPAGLGMFYKSELSLTMAIDNSLTESRFLGVNSDDSRTTFNIGSFEALLAVPTENPGADDFRAIQFGIGMNRLRSFNNRTYVESGVTPYSLLDNWSEMANKDGYLDEFSTQMAYNLYLLDTLPGGAFYNNFLSSTENVYQTRRTTTSGGINEMVFSMSANRDDKLYMGLTIGVPFLSYYRSSTYRETVENRGDYFDYTENYDVDAIGFNLKLGVIYRPVEMLRFGFAIHTPTWYDVKGVYSTRMSNGRTTDHSRESDDVFAFRTPMKLIGSIGATFGNQSSSVAGSLDLDYEFTNYQGMRITALDEEKYISDVNYEMWRKSVNRVLEDNYQSGHTLRFGGSLNVRHFVLRAGVAYFSNPYREYEEYEHKNVESVLATAGFGYRTSNYFVDFAYAHSVYQDWDIPLANPSYELIRSNYYNNLFITTIGFKF